ncbi:hypothetical protein [Streptomyces syringium]|uniref:hypothetical protein n=1 Tax=Streptomyces syringium TaxID=76729 RepID=UPI0034150B34
MSVRGAAEAVGEAAAPQHGFDSALLAERVGARDVITVEVAHRLAAGARRALDTAGYGDLQTVAGDGEEG